MPGRRCTASPLSLRALASEIDRLEAQILAWHCAEETSRRFATIPDIGPIIASAISAAVADTSLFKSGQQFAAWLGLTPRANSFGGKERLGGITKQGDGYLRWLPVVGVYAGSPYRTPDDHWSDY